MGNGIYNKMKCHPIMKNNVTPAVESILSIFPWPLFFGVPGFVFQTILWFVLDPLLLCCPLTCPFEFTWLVFVQWPFVTAQFYINIMFVLSVMMVILLVIVGFFTGVIPFVLVVVSFFMF